MLPYAGSCGQRVGVKEWLESPYLGRVAARVARSFGLPSQDVPDLLQDLRIALWQAGPGVSVNATWLFHTANHKAVDLLTARNKRRVRERDSSQLNRSNDTADSEVAHLLSCKVARLPEKLRAFYVLRYREGLTQRETARRLGLGRSSVRWLELRCLRMIRGRKALSVNIARLPAPRTEGAS